MLLAEWTDCEIMWIKAFKSWKFESDILHKSILRKHDVTKGKQ